MPSMTFSVETLTVYCNHERGLYLRELVNWFWLYLIRYKIEPSTNLNRTIWGSDFYIF